MATAVFHIDELDCAEEVGQLRRELEPVSGVRRLDFDLLHQRLTIDYREDLVSTRDLATCIRRTGMHGRECPTTGQRESLTTAAPDVRRLALAILAAALLLLGYGLHAWESGWQAALGRDGVGAAEGPVPWPARIAYLLSVVAGGWYVVPRAWAALCRRHADMHLLMCVAVVGAMLLHEWLEASLVAFLFAVALLLEQASVARARRAIGKLLDLTPQTARCRVLGESWREKPVRDVTPGETVVVRPGERIPLDGVVANGRSAVNEAPITGESLPVTKQPGDFVYAGTINGDELLEFTVTKAAGETTLAHIATLIQSAQNRRAATERWIDHFAARYTPAMFALAVLVAVVPPLAGFGSWSDWAYNALVLLVIACPCALVISTPVTIVSALTAASRNGVLIKGGEHLESAAGLQAVVFDKTGTLTYGRPEVQEVVPWSGHDRAELLRIAATLEQHSSHPLAQAVLRRARHDDIAPGSAQEQRLLGGLGVEGVIDGQRFWIGNERLLRERLPNADAELSPVLTRLADAGHTVVVVGNSAGIRGLISLADELRPEAHEAVASLRRLGLLTQVLLTGDNEPTARAVQRTLGLDRVAAHALPAEKAQVVESLRRHYGTVAMVGDGVNDGPALASANLGIAMGAIGSDAAIETADVALMADDLSKIPWLIAHARRALRTVRQNVAFALATKLLFVGLAVTGRSSLWLAIAADMGASLLVIFNGLRLLDGSRGYSRSGLPSNNA